MFLRQILKHICLKWSMDSNTVTLIYMDILAVFIDWHLNERLWMALARYFALYKFILLSVIRTWQLQSSSSVEDWMFKNIIQEDF